MLDNLNMVIKDIPKQSKKPMDKGILAIVCCLCFFGMIMIWSASMYNAKLSGDEFYYVKKQLLYFLVGLVILLLFSVLNVKYLKYYSNIFLIIAVVMLVIVMFTPEDESVKGAVRSLSIAGIVIQPSEFTKLSVLFFVSFQLEKRMNEISSFKTFCLMLVFLSTIVYIIYQQPALSTSMIIAATIIALYFIAGGRFSFIFTTVAIAGVAVFFFITQNPWRMQRMLAHADPFEDILGDGWQPAQSLMALGSGGIFGQGIGNGRAKLSFLPEPQNDYIFSIIGEELGLIGCVAIIIVFFLLIMRIIKVALAATDTFSSLFCAGTAVLLAIQVFLNIGVVTNLLPSTGVVLPFISAGGSSLITFMISIGVVLNVSRNQRPSAELNRRIEK